MHKAFIVAALGVSFFFAPPQARATSKRGIAKAVAAARTHNQEIATAMPFVGFVERTQRQARNIGNRVVALAADGADAHVSKTTVATRFVDTHSQADTPSSTNWTSLSSASSSFDQPREHRMVMERVHRYADGSTRSLKRYVTMLKGTHSGMSLEKTVFTRSNTGRLADEDTVIKNQLLYPDGKRKAIKGEDAHYVESTVHGVQAR